MQYQQFTPEMRKTHTILVPNMLPIHFRLLISIFGQFGTTWNYWNPPPVRS